MKPGDPVIYFRLTLSGQKAIYIAEISDEETDRVGNVAIEFKRKIVDNRKEVGDVAPGLVLHVGRDYVMPRDEFFKSQKYKIFPWVFITSE